MDSIPIIAAVTDGNGDFIVGILLGTCLGYLVGPAFRSWQAYREWTEASREVRLADRLLMKLEADTDSEEIVQPRIEDNRPAGRNGHPTRSTWRTSH